MGFAIGNVGGQRDAEILVADQSAHNIEICTKRESRLESTGKVLHGNSTKEFVCCWRYRR